MGRKINIIWEHYEDGNESGQVPRRDGGMK